MSKVCQITGKKAQIGCNVSHSKHHTKRSFDVNLFSKLCRRELLDSVEDQRRWPSHD